MGSSRARDSAFAAALIVHGAAVSLAVLPGCGGPAPLPAVGEALVIVDTDLPVPTFVNRLRVDVYTADGGTWYQSRDTIRSQTSDWPLSFGLPSPDATHERVALVRLRAYAEGEVRDYRGERFLPIPDASAPPFDLPASPTPTDQPRLQDDHGSDVTPATEPDPLLAVDRLFLVRVPAGVRGAARVVLRGDCLGTMADLAGGRSCVDTRAVLTPVAEIPLDPNMALPSTSQQGTFGAPVPCTATPRPPGKNSAGTPLYDEEICVDGGMFIMGTGDSIPLLPDLPKRIAVVPPFRMDKYEVTVARWRAAIDAGFVPDGTPNGYEGPTPTSGAAVEDPIELCSYSVMPNIGREDFALTCLTWNTAHLLCQFLGGDLPTEAQWEYAAGVAGRPYRTRYPWGGDDAVLPTCNRVVAQRGSDPGLNDACAASQGFGPLPVAARDGAGGDVTPLGIVGMGGGVSEMTFDAAADFGANCWASAPLVSPSCVVPNPPANTVRGGTWNLNWEPTAVGYREPLMFGYTQSNKGFRCVRGGT